MRLEEAIDIAATIAGSQNELARRLGMTTGRLSLIRHRKAACPAWALLQIAEIGRVDPAALALSEVCRKAGKALACALAGAGATLLVFAPFDRAQAAGVSGDPGATVPYV